MTDNKSKHWHPRRDNDGILWLAINVANSSTNSLSAEVLTELSSLLEGMSEDPPVGLVIHSTKPSGFIAGADVNEFTQINTPEEAVELIQRGQSIMARIASLPFPTVAAIKGFCLGGGMEMALACDYRIAVNDPSTRLGLPEVKLGIHPGFGGTVRSIAAMGSLKAMELMLTGRSLSARQAKRAGLVHESVPERQMMTAAIWYIQHRPSQPALSLKEKLIRSAAARPLLAKVFRKQTRNKANPKHYPAPFALIDLWEEYGSDPDAMYAPEAQSVARLITGDTAKNLIRVFQLQNHLKSYGKKTDFQARHVHVIGAGTMGGDIAIWCALQGFDVTVEDSNTKALAATRMRAEKLYARRFREFPHLKTAAHDRLLPDPKGQGRKHADIIIEAIFEDQQAKQNLFSELEPVVKEDAILASNTSSIPLERIASALKNPGRLVGLHFFNPVAKMPLVEVVRSTVTTDDIMTQAQAFTRQIAKLPLPVKSTPGFLVNRILMPYLLEAAILQEQGASTATIDLAATDFGMPMGPLELADTVGLDICRHVAEQLAEPMGLTVPNSIRSRTDSGKLGRKSGEGFYRWEKGKKVQPDKTGQVDMALQQQLIDKLTQEAQLCLKEGIVATADDVDAGVIFGTGFAPFRGGPLTHLRGQSNKPEDQKAIK